MPAHVRVLRCVAVLQLRETHRLQEGEEDDERKKAFPTWFCNVREGGQINEVVVVAVCNAWADCAFCLCVRKSGASERKKKEKEKGGVLVAHHCCRCCR